MKAFWRESEEEEKRAYTHTYPIKRAMIRIFLQPLLEHLHGTRHLPPLLSFQASAEQQTHPSQIDRSKQQNYD